MFFTLHKFNCDEITSNVWLLQIPNVVHFFFSKPALPVLILILETELDALEMHQDVLGLHGLCQFLPIFF